MVDFVEDSEMRELTELHQELFEVDSGLYSNEIDFLESLVEWDNNFTVGQALWLRKIHARLL